MAMLIQIGQLLLSLSLLIILHELGHFLFARLFKTRVEKFYLFFDPWFSIFKLKKGDTEYGIGWLPLGGYVKISGMIDESMDKEQLSQPPQPHEFRSKPAWQRLLIMLGGVMVNLILGVVVYSFILFIWGDKYIPNKNLTDGVWVTDSLMNSMGLKTGDKIISVNGNEPVDYIDALEEMLYGGKVKINRNGADTILDWPTNFAGQIADYRITYKGPFILPRIPFIIGEVPDSSINSNSGLKPKDRVMTLNGADVKYYDQFPLVADTLRGKTVPLLVIRNGQNIEIPVTISENGKIEVVAAELSFDQLEKLGIYSFAVHKYSFWQAIPAGLSKAKMKIVSYLRQLKLIFNFETGAYKGVGGFKAIKDLFPAQWDWQIFWEITGFLSLMLAVLNLLPIPALDGGHVTFLLFEMITGRRPGEKFLEYAQIVGMILLFTLLIYANGNDIYRWISGLIANK